MGLSGLHLFPGLVRLDIRANRVMAQAELRQLSSWDGLRALSLRRNPVERTRGLRVFLVNVLPQLEACDVLCGGEPRRCGARWDSPVLFSNKRRAEELNRLQFRFSLVEFLAGLTGGLGPRARELKQLERDFTVCADSPHEPRGPAVDMRLRPAFRPPPRTASAAMASPGVKLGFAVTCEVALKQVVDVKPIERSTTAMESRRLQRKAAGAAVPWRTGHGAAAVPTSPSKPSGRRKAPAATGSTSSWQTPRHSRAVRSHCASSSLRLPLEWASAVDELSCSSLRRRQLNLMEERSLSAIQQFDTNATLGMTDSSASAGESPERPIPQSVLRPGRAAAGDGLGVSNASRAEEELVDAMVNEISAATLAGAHAAAGQRVLGLEGTLLGSSKSGEEHKQVSWVWPKASAEEVTPGVLTEDPSADPSATELSGTPSRGGTSRTLQLVRHRLEEIWRLQASAAIDALDPGGCAAVGALGQVDLATSTCSPRREPLQRLRDPEARGT